MSLNAEIKEIFNNYSFDGEEIPVKYLRYNGKLTTYITYQNESNNGELRADDKLQGYIAFYDFDIYSKSDYYDLMDDVINKLEDAGWTYHPSRNSPDLYETDTGYYHKTLSFSKEIEREDS